MGWTVAAAKQHFSDVLRRATREPQLIVRRERPVAAVIGPGELDEFLAWRASRTTRPLAEALAEAVRICEDEDYALELPEGADRPTPLLPEAHRARHRRTRPGD